MNKMEIACKLNYKFLKKQIFKQVPFYYVRGKVKKFSANKWIFGLNFPHFLLLLIIITKVPENFEVVAKKKLQTDIDYDFTLLSIISPAKPHRLCSIINSELDLQLAKSDEISSPSDTTPKSVTFKTFHFTDRVARKDYFLICNKSEGHPLIPERKAVDFFLLINTLLPESEIKELLQQLKDLSIIQMSFKDDIEQLNSKEKLLLV
jgi:hypothetical protein